jgi:hypothetical protein
MAFVPSACMACIGHIVVDSVAAGGVWAFVGLGNAIESTRAAPRRVLMWVSFQKMA